MLTPLIRFGAPLAVLFALHLGSAQAQYVQMFSGPIVTPQAMYASPSVVTPQATFYAPGPISYPARVVVPQAAVTSYSYYPNNSFVTPQSLPATVTYSPPPLVSYAAPPTFVQSPSPAPGLYTVRTYNGYGIFRPRGTVTETYYTPLIPR